MSTTTRNTLFALAIALQLPLAGLHAAETASHPTSNKTATSQTTNSSKKDHVSDAGHHRFYGGGTTISEKATSRTRRSTEQQNSGRVGNTESSAELVTGEQRSRIYGDSKLDLEKGEVEAVVGTEAQYNAARFSAEAGAETKSAKIGDVDVARAYTGAQLETTVGAQVGAQAGAEINTKNFADSKLIAEAGAATGVTVSGEATAGVELAGVNTEAKAETTTFVGASTKVKATASKDGLDAKAGAFAGARAEGSVGGSVAGVGAKAKGEAWAGVGAEASGKARFKNGKLTLGGEVGAGLGVGGKAGTEVTVDAGQTIEDAQQLGKTTKGLARQAAPKVGNAARKVSGTIDRQQTKARRTVSRNANNAGRSVKKAASGTTKPATRGLSNVRIAPPKKTTRKITPPKIKAPKVKAPKIKAPKIKAPKIKVPKKSKKSKKSKRFPF